MALRSLVRQLPSDASAIRTVRSQLPVVSFHTDVAAWQDNETTNGASTPSDHPDASVRQTRSSARQSNPAEDASASGSQVKKREIGGVARKRESRARAAQDSQATPTMRSDSGPQQQQRRPTRAPGSSSNNRAPGQRQPPGPDQRQREFPRSDRFQYAGNDLDDRHMTPAAEIARPTGPAKWPSNLAEDYDRQARHRLPDVGPMERYQRQSAQQGTQSQPRLQQQPRAGQGPGRASDRPDLQDDRRVPFQAARPITDGPYQRPSDRSDRPNNRRPPFQGGHGQNNAQQGLRRQPAEPTGQNVYNSSRLRPEADDPDVTDVGAPRRNRGLGSSSRRRPSPGSSQLEQPNFPSRMRGSASRGQAPGAPMASQRGFEDGEADAQQDQELEIIPSSMLERQKQNVRGVPAAWREEIEDQEDKDDLEEARLISQFNRRRMSGEVAFEDDKLKDDIHALQMNLDPKLDFGWGTPRMSEVEPVSGQQMLEEAKGPLCAMLDIADEQQWQALTQGIAESFDAIHPVTQQSAMKPRVQEAMLERYVEQAVPKEHPSLPIISQSLTMLQHNPNWGFHKKCQYMQRLIKDVL